MKGFKKEWKISLEPRSNLPFVLPKKTEEQCFTENDSFARDRKPSLKNAMFLQVGIVHLFSIIKKGLDKACCLEQFYER